MLNQLGHVAGIVLPLYVIIAVGQLGFRAGLIDDKLREGLSRVVFYIAVPPLLFYKLAECDFQQAFGGRTVFAVAALLIVSAAVIYFCGARAKLAPDKLGAFTQGAFRSNMVFMGLPVCFRAFGPEIIAPAAIYLTVMIPAYNIVSVTALLAPHAGNGRRFDWLTIVKGIATNPLILACAAGISFSWFRLPLPKVAADTCGLIGQIGLPLALIELGAGMRLKHLHGAAGLAGLSTVVKLLAMPLLTYALLRLWCAPTDDHFRIAVIMMACPTAMISYIMARQMKGDGTLVAQQVILSTLGSILTIPLWLLLLLRGG